MTFRERRGCEVPTKTPFKLDPEIVEGKAGFKYVFDLCPVNYIQPEHKFMIGLFALWKQGKMLDEGGVGNQSAKYIDCMMFLDALWNQHEREQLEARKK